MLEHCFVNVLIAYHTNDDCTKQKQQKQLSDCTNLTSNNLQLKQ